jgi:O6-methylguanine-DNA--protein-cysteine methyltransferase
MYIMKVKGTARIPDYVQIRDDNFTLIAYFRADRPEKELLRLGLKEKENEIMKRINEIPYGKISPLGV